MSDKWSYPEIQEDIERTEKYYTKSRQRNKDYNVYRHCQYLDKLITEEMEGEYIQKGIGDIRVLYACRRRVRTLQRKILNKNGECLQWRA